MSSNGNLTVAELSPAVGGVAGPDPGQGQLANAAAVAWNAMDAQVAKDRGVHLACDGPDSMYRPYADQVRLRAQWCAQGACQNAAVPGTSNHGLGIAVDMPPYCQAICDAPEYAHFGWNKQYSDAPWESWHRKYGGTYTGPVPSPHKPVNKYPTLHIGDKGGAVHRAQVHLRRWNEGMTRPATDSDFGKTTLKAVEEFQIVHGMKPDGVIGPSTWKELRVKDHLLDDERNAVNKIRLITHRKGAPTKAQRKTLRTKRVFCAKRARSIKKVAAQYGWTGKGTQHRAERFHILRKVAGGKYNH